MAFFIPETPANSCVGSSSSSSSPVTLASSLEKEVPKRTAEKITPFVFKTPFIGRIDVKRPSNSPEDRNSARRPESSKVHSRENSPGVVKISFRGESFEVSRKSLIPLEFWKKIESNKEITNKDIKDFVQTINSDDYSKAAKLFKIIASEEPEAFKNILESKHCNWRNLWYLLLLTRQHKSSHSKFLSQCIQRPYLWVRPDCISENFFLEILHHDQLGFINEEQRLKMIKVWLTVNKIKEETILNQCKAAAVNNWYTAKEVEEYWRTHDVAISFISTSTPKSTAQDYIPFEAEAHAVRKKHGKNLFITHSFRLSLDNKIRTIYFSVSKQVCALEFEWVGYRDSKMPFKMHIDGTSISKKRSYLWLQTDFEPELPKMSYLKIGDYQIEKGTTFSSSGQQKRHDSIGIRVAFTIFDAYKKE